MNIGKPNNKQFLFCSLCSIILTSLISLNLIKIEQNIFFYILLCITFFVSFLLTFFIIKRINSFDFNSKYLILIGTIILLIIFYFSDGFPINKWNINIYDLAWHGSKKIILPLLIPYLLIVFILFNKYNNEKDYLFYIVLFITCTISFYINYQIYTIDGYSFYHRHAYLYEIEKCYYSVPYSSITSSIYGHYGIFYILPLKLLGGFNLENVTIIICFVNTLFNILFCLTIKKITNNKAISILSTIAYLFPLVLSTDGSLYYQLTTHRMILVVLFILNVVYYKDNKKSKIIFFISAVFSLISSNDIGLIFIICYFIYNIIANVYKYKKPILPTICISIGLLIAVLTCAICIVNIYNLCTNGEFIFLDFFYPYNNGITTNVWQISFNQYEYAINYLNDVIIENKDSTTLTSKVVLFLAKFVLNNNLARTLLLPCLYFYYWNIAALLFIGIYSFINRKKECSITLLIICIFGLGSAVYYINRPTYGNLSILLPINIFVFAYLLEHILVNRYDRLAIVLILNCLAFSSLISIPKTLETIYENRKQNAFEDIKEIINKKVPKDTYIIGTGSFEVCSKLGYEKFSKIDDIDFVGSDSTLNALKKELNENKRVLIFSYYDNRLWGSNINDYISNKYNLVFSYSNDNICLNYYEK